RELAKQIVHAGLRCSAPEAADAERAVTRRPASRIATALCDLLAPDDRALGEEIGAQRRVELGVVAAEPLERHRRLLLLLVVVVRDELLEGVVLRGVDALVVAVDGFQLLTQRGGRAVALDRVLLEQLGVFVQPHTRRHSRPPLPGGSRARAHTSQPTAATFRAPPGSSTASDGRRQCRHPGCAGDWP